MKTKVFEQFLTSRFTNQDHVVISKRMSKSVSGVKGPETEAPHTVSNRGATHSVKQRHTHSEKQRHTHSQQQRHTNERSEQSKRKTSSLK